MNFRKTELVIVGGIGSELLDIVSATVNYELSGDGCILIHTEDIPDNKSKVNEILKAKYPTYEGLVLLRR
jgi:hypothetical protein